VGNPAGNQKHLGHQGDYFGARGQRA